MNRLKCAAVVCCALALAAGCRSAQEKDFAFDAGGWGGPNLKYSLDPATHTLTIERGMLINRDFRWGAGEFSFEFLDTRDLIWGVLLLDEVFKPARRQNLLTTAVRFGNKEFIPGRDLPPDQMWKFDMVLDVQFRPDKSDYRVLDCLWYETFLDDGRRGVLLSVLQEVRVKPNDWNTFSAKVVGGKLAYSVNGVPGKGTIQMEPRANGRVGISVLKGGPLYIRNLKYSPQFSAQDAAKP